MFAKRSTELERIDTGDYTTAEYERFLKEIAFINRYLGDRRALKRSLIHEIEDQDLKEYSVLDVGSGSGELLRNIVKFSRRSGRNVKLVGIDLNEISAQTARADSKDHPEISSVRGDAFHLPFADGSFDFAISSLFLHHLTDDQIPQVLKEMSRVARRGIFILDLHRHPVAYVFYRLFCFAFRISPLVTHDGSLSILKGFRPKEMNRFGTVIRSFPFRLVLRS
jgi:ubiquinone/menaquinone biosynthesis C-methylase UbiE